MLFTVNIAIWFLLLISENSVLYELIFNLFKDIYSLISPKDFFSFLMVSH